MRRRVITLRDGRTTFIEDDEGTEGISLTIDGAASEREVHDDDEWKRLQEKHPARAKVKDINKEPRE